MPVSSLPRGADVDQLLSPPDGSLARTDMQYLETHSINTILNEALSNLVQLMPLDPVQYLIDSIEFSPEFAKQDPENGLPEHRKHQLVDVFNAMDVDGRGFVTFDGLQDFIRQRGGEVLQDQELQSIFTDFQPQGGTQVTLKEFLLYFSKVSRTLPNKVFQDLVKDLLQSSSH